jgi:hypothetical protein
LFSIALKLVFNKINLLFITLIFLSSFLIDFDHYLCAVIKNKSLSLKKAFDYHKIQGEIARRELKRGIKRKGDFHLFHTVEFIAFVGLLGFVWIGFLYIFIGLVFHSLLDVLYLAYHGNFYGREFILGNWIATKIRTLIKR